MNKKAILVFVLSIIALGWPAGQARAGVDVGVSIGDEGLRGFYLAVGDYFRVPQREVIVIREKKKIRDSEVPVVLFLASRAKVSPSVIIDLRLAGRSWWDITLHYGLGPEIYYVPVKDVEGPPYGKAYGHYKNKPKKEWKKIVLDDDDVVNMVNLRFVSEHYGVSADAVVRMREGGKDFIVINDEVSKKKKKGHDDHDHDHDKHDHDHGKKDKHKGKKD